MEFIKKYFRNKKLGFWLSFSAGAVAVLSSVVYVIVYAAMATDGMDRVFSVLNLVLMLVGGISGIVLEYFGFKFSRIIPAVLYSVGFASHVVETAYPLADILTGVAFLGGNLTVALVFVVLFALSLIASIVASFVD